MHRLPAVIAFMAALLPAQTFTYADFSSVAGLVLNNNAAQAGTALRLTPSAISQRGSAWYSVPVDVASGFDTTFTFQITSNVGGGADGMAFVIHADPRFLAAIGNHANALGYGAFLTAPAGTAIANSLAIELDTYFTNFGGYSDLGANEISVHTGGSADNSQSEGYSIGRMAPATSLKNGAIHTVRIHYVPGSLAVEFNGTQVLSIAYDFITGGTWILPGTPVGGLSLLGTRQALVGFTASTGGAWSAHDVLSWTWTSSEGCLKGQVGTSVGGPYDVVLINGSSGGPGRLVQVAQNQPLAIDVLLAPGSLLLSANFILLAEFGFPVAGASFPLPPLGTLCFVPPLPGLPATSFVLFDTFGLGLGAFFPATPAPFSFNLPAGLPFPIQLTLQGALEEAPGVLSITNGVMLQVP